MRLSRQRPLSSSVMPFLCRISLLIALLNLSGCAFMFWPHWEQVVPTVSGTLLRDGKPVSGASVFLLPSLGRKGCPLSSKYAAVTDTGGHFAIRGDRDLALFVVMGDRLDSWGICINESGNVIEALHARAMGFPPRSFEVICELNQPEACKRA